MDITLSIMFAEDMRAISQGRRLLRIVDEVYPEVFPTRFGQDEPLSHIFERERLDDCIGAVWAEGFIWRGRGSEAVWSVPRGARAGHHDLFLYGSLDVSRGLELTERLTREWRVDIACIHMPATPEFEATRSAHRTMFAPFNSGLATIALKQYLPNLAWGTFFGHTYVALIGHDRLLATPAAVATAWGDGIFIQLTNEINDVLEYELFDAVRRRAKEHIGLEYFFDPTGAVSAYRAPEFKLPEPTKGA